jgi:hypothetical protein
MKSTGENRSTRGKTCTSATLSTTNPTWTDPGSIPGLLGGRPAANRLSHGTANALYLRVKSKIINRDFAIWPRAPYVSSETQLGSSNVRPHKSRINRCRQVFAVAGCSLAFGHGLITRIIAHCSHVAL